MTLAHVLEDLAFLIAHWEDLHDTRLPGTPRPWQPPRISDDKREQLDREARAERLERAEFAPGEHADAVPPDVLVVLVDVAEFADRLTAQVCADVGCPLWLPPAGAWRADGQLAHLAWHLEQDPVDGDLVDQVDLEARQLAQDTALVLRLLRDGQVLDSSCPWCRMPTALQVTETPAGPLIVCRSRLACSPPDADCSIWLQGRPAWADYEWDWLANRIRHADPGHQPRHPTPETAHRAAGVRLAYEAARRDGWVSYCSICSEDFRDLNEHMAAEHRCATCWQKLPNRAARAAHIAAKHPHDTPELAG